MPETRNDPINELRRVLSEQRSDQYRQYYRIERGFAELTELLNTQVAQKDARITDLEAQLQDTNRQMGEVQILLMRLLERLPADEMQALQYEYAVVAQPQEAAIAVGESTPGSNLLAPPLEEREAVLTGRLTPLQVEEETANGNGHSDHEAGRVRLPDFGNTISPIAKLVMDAASARTARPESEEDEPQIEKTDRLDVRALKRGHRALARKERGDSWLQ